MANPRGNPSNLVPFRPGQSGNPGGKPKGARNRLESDFLHDLAEDYRQHGKAAIERLFQKDPAAYLRIVASLVPKDPEPVGAFDQLDDVQLSILIELVRALRERQEARTAGEAALPETQSAQKS
jgi:hypothetical protein